MNEQVREELEEHLRSIMEIAQIHKLPFFFTMAVENAEDNTVYRKELLSAQILGVALADDTIRKHELVEAGFDVMPPRDNITLSMEDLMNG